jgi:hypothetical protein
MSPINEAASVEDEDDDFEDEDDAELDVISEYDTLKAKAAPFARSMTAPLIPRIQFEDDESCSEDQGYEGEQEEDQPGKS